ncbi:MAG: ABC transporter substrate-binding protein [Sterolibacterium sp.]
MNKFALFGIFWLASAALAQAADLAPDELVKNVTNEVLSIVRSDQDIQAGSNEKAIELIETKVQQHFNFVRMARLALGRNWKKANETQKKQIADEFHRLLVRTYSMALTEYKNQTVKFLPFNMNPGATDVKVQAKIVQNGARPISFNYYLGKLPTGWKVYDIEVSGISLVINYRSSFADEVRNNGIEGLIESLQAKNKKNGTTGEKK